MTRGEAWLHHCANLTVGASGLAYAWMLYLVEPEPDEFGMLPAVNHPWQETVRNFHIWLAPLLVFGLGMIWRRHVWRRVRSGYRWRRKSGLGLAATALPMVASGYLLQTAVEESWRTTWTWIHVGTGGLWVLAYLVHQLSRPGKARDG